jgi:hypothetical protein
MPVQIEYAPMSLRDMDALKGIPTWWLSMTLFHVGADFSPHIGAEAPTHRGTGFISSQV